MVRRVDAVKTKNDESGKWVNQYHLLQKVGAGTFCKVLLAKSDTGIHAVKRFGRTVLKKRMVAKFDAGGASTVPFQQCIDEEIRILGRMSHPHVVQLQEVLDDPLDENLYLIFEGLPGGQLMNWNEQSCSYSAGPAVERLGSAVTDSRPFADGPGEERNIFVFSEVLAKHFAHQLADGIAYIHSLGVIHKDLKPDNLVLSREVPEEWLCQLDVSRWPKLPVLERSKDLPKVDDGELVVKIADFNCAEECPGPNFEIFDAQGTQNFTPPECFRKEDDGVIKGKPRDMWSLGCVLFVLVYGRCPFWAEDNLLLQLQIMQCTLEMPTGGPVLSKEWTALLQSLLSRDPSARPTAEALMQSDWLK